MKIELSNLHWIDGGEPENDLCAHANVSIEISNTKLHSKTEDFTVSAMCLFLLRSLSQDYDGNNQWGNFLIPCCGHSIWKNENQEDLKYDNIVYVGGCCNGIDWMITHENNFIIHSYKELSEKMNYKEWENIVFSLCDEVEKFYNESKEKEISDSWEREGYNLFWKEWKKRKLTTASS